MIIVAEGIPGNPANTCQFIRRPPIQRPVIIHRDADDASRPGKIRPHVRTLIDPTSEIFHLARLAFVNPLSEVAGERRRRRWRDPYEVKPQFVRMLLDPQGEGVINKFLRGHDGRDYTPDLAFTRSISGQ